MHVYLALYNWYKNTTIKRAKKHILGISANWSLQYDINSTNVNVRFVFLKVRV